MMRGFICSLFMFALGGYCFAQGDLPTTPIKIEGFGKNDKSDNSKPVSPLNLNTDLLNTPTPNLPGADRSNLDMTNKDVNLMKNEQFLDPGEKFKKKANKSLPKDENNSYGATSTQYLGDFKTKSKQVKIVCRDHQYVDGDRVRVLINDRVIQPNILLDAVYKGFYVELEPGFNKIDFQALNQGASGPNTAAFAVYGDSGEVISSNMWNLSTGVKATMIVVKEID